MKILKYINTIALTALVALSFTSCKDDKLGPTIFPDVSEEIDPNSASYKFDKWLKQNYLDVYNLEFQYKMEDVGTNMNYNLVPATYANSIDLAVLTKYLWFDSYEEVTGSKEFLRAYGPRILMLIGSPAYNPTTGTMILGLAEGGIKVSLFRVNSMDYSNFHQLNEYYFKTMHHEFSHILHQQKSIPSEFRIISTGHYDAQNWQDRQAGVVYSLGFASDYGSSEMREDFAEIIANFITNTDAEWALKLDWAGRGWAPDGDALDDDVIYYCFYYYPGNNPTKDDGTSSQTYIAYEKVSKDDNGNYVVTGEYQKGITPYKTVDGVRVDANGERVDNFGFLLDSAGNRIPIKAYEVPDTDGVDGVATLNQKVQIARVWFKEQWGIDLDQLRSVVQRRQLDYDIEALRQQIDDVQ